SISHECTIRPTKSPRGRRPPTIERGAMRRASPAMRSALTFIAGWGLLSPLGTAAREQPPSGVGTGSAPPEEVVVEGRHEGPRMWTVRKGDHTLWILGTLSPLPKRMVWQPDAVQEVLRNVQEVVPAWPAYSIGANPLTALRVYIEWRHLQKPPDHMPLEQALPPPLYARVETLKARFDPNDGKLEEMRPMHAKARAWALGDVDTLRRLPHVDDRTACVAAVSTSDRVRKLISRALDDWLIAVEDSLTRNRGTLAVQSMDRLLGENGGLAAL